MNAGVILGLVTLMAALVLGWRSVQSTGMPFERKARYAAIWAVIIIVLAFVAGRIA